MTVLARLLTPAPRQIARRHNVLGRLGRHVGQLVDRRLNKPVCDAQEVNTRPIVILQITFLSKTIIAHLEYRTTGVQGID